MKKSGFNFAGLAMAAAVIVFMAGWRVWSASLRPSHLWEIGTEVGSVAELRYPFAVSSHDGNRLLVAMDAETGPGILFFDAATGVRKWLYEENQKGYVWAHYKVLGWSPDDRLLVFGHQTAPRTQEHELITGDLFIADGATGATLATIRVAPDSTNTLSQLTWLSPNAFAFLTAKQDLLVYEQQGTNWLNTHTFTNATSGNFNEAQAFMAMSPTSVTWRMREAVWTFDFGAGKAVKAWGTIKNNTTTNTLLDSYFSRDMGKFLLTCRNGTNRFLYTFDPADNSLTEFDAIPRRTPLTGAAWINHGKGYAFLSPEWGIESLSVKTNLASEPVHLLKRGEVRSYTVNGDRLCIVGVMTNEPPGVWEYNVTTGALRCLMSSATLPLEYTTCVPFEFAMVTNAANKRYATHLWKPYREEPGKKYPLVLGNTPYSWTPYPMASGNAGYYFMTVDRPGWDTESLKDWPELVLGLFDEMAKNPHVDTNQVYLYARSIETGPMSKLLSEKPQMWRGAIMFDPGGELPSLKSDYPMKLFIAAGREDKEAVQELGPYQEKAADAGVPAKIVFLDNAPHISYGVAVQRQRIQELAKFLGGEETR